MKDLSERQYKAFISYRHRPLDMLVAKKLQRTIERFVIPADLRENGQKRLGYVFRDQSELTVSSDLSEIIHDALDRSEYLIVVCTPDAAQSEWVNEEIKYFLSNHDRDHVMAVLASGEPEESFPPALTDEITEDGTVRYIEPLAANVSADNMFSRSVQFRSEVLRILSVLIGCGYDTLYRRDHRYNVIRRSLIIGALLFLAASDIGLLINRNLKIKSNYDQSLRNQSIYYAAESQRLLESGDRFSAIRLAMEALPSSGDKRPLVSQAVYALSQAENVYTAPSDEKVTGAVGMLTHGSSVLSYIFSSDGSLLCSKTDENTITMWDASNMKQLWKIQVESSALSRPLRIMDDGSVCIMSGDEIISMDSKNGEVNWRKDIQKLFPGNEYIYIHQLLVPEESDEVLLNTADGYYIVSMRDGSLIRGYPAPSFSVDGIPVERFMSVPAVSQDGRYLIGVFGYVSDSYLNAISVIDTYTGQLLSVWAGLPEHASDIQVRLFPGEGLYTAAYAIHDSRLGLDFSADSVLSYNSMTVCGISIDSGKQLWAYSSEYVIPGPQNCIQLLEDSGGTDLIVHVYSNRIDVLELLTGERTGSAESASSIVAAETDGRVINAVTESGDLIVLDTVYPDYWRSSRLFVNDLGSAHITSSSVWVLQDSSDSLICYSTVASDPQWSEYSLKILSEHENDLFQIDSMVQDGIVAFLFANMNGRFSVVMGDGSPSSVLREVILQDKYYGEPLSSCEIKDFYEGKLILYWETESRWGYMEIDASTLKVTSSYPERYADSVFSCYAGKGRFCLVYSEDMPGYDENKYHLSILDTSSETKYSTFLGRYSAGCSIYCIFDPQGMIYAVIPEATSVKKIDPLIGTRLDIPAGITDLILSLPYSEYDTDPPVIWSDDGSFTASKNSNTQIRITDSDGNRLFTAEEDVLRIAFYTFTRDSRYLLVMGSDDRLRRYDVRTGELVSSIRLHARYYSGMYSYSFPEGKDFMTILAGDTLNMISTDDWELLAYVQDCVGYQRTNDIFVCYKEDTEISYGCFRRYTVQMLIDHAEELLNGWDLTYDQRAKYGINVSP